MKKAVGMCQRPFSINTRRSPQLSRVKVPTLETPGVTNSIQKSTLRNLAGHLAAPRHIDDLLGTAGVTDNKAIPLADF